MYYMYYIYDKVLYPKTDEIGVILCTLFSRSSIQLSKSYSYVSVSDLYWCDMYINKTVLLVTVSIIFLLVCLHNLMCIHDIYMAIGALLHTNMGFIARLM